MHSSWVLFEIGQQVIDGVIPTEFRPKKWAIVLLSALVLFASIFIEKVISQNEPNYENVT